MDKGSQVIYVEFEQNERTKRFVLPESENIKLKIEQFVKETANLDLVRYGNATVASKVDDDSGSIGLEEVPSTVTAVFNIDLADHPVLVNGQGRYSTELIEAIQKIELFTAPVVETEKPKVAASLTDQLKQQVAQQAIDKLSADKEKKDEKEFVKVSAPPAEKEKDKPVENNMSLTEFIEKNKKQKQPTALFERKPRPQPVSKIDRILEKIERIEISLGLQEEMETADDSVRAEQLRDWFESHVDSVGWERTFEILAGKIKI